MIEKSDWSGYVCIVPAILPHLGTVLPRMWLVIIWELPFLVNAVLLTLEMITFCYAWSDYGFKKFLDLHEC